MRTMGSAALCRTLFESVDVHRGLGNVYSGMCDQAAYLEDLGRHDIRRS